LKVRGAWDFLPKNSWFPNFAKKIIVSAEINWQIYQKNLPVTILSQDYQCQQQLM
jgi:hypothetical protein